MVKIPIILFYSFLFYSFLFFSFLFFSTFLFFSMFPHGFDLPTSRARRPLQGDRIIHTDGRKISGELKNELENEHK